jgi:predicted  nucleic acid-binding Zn-ribbon protein
MSIFIEIEINAKIRDLKRNIGITFISSIEFRLSDLLLATEMDENKHLKEQITKWKKQNTQLEKMIVAYETKITKLEGMIGKD